MSRWLLAWLLACTMTTVFMPDGNMRFCTTCCDASGQHCTVRCN